MDLRLSPEDVDFLWLLAGVRSWREPVRFLSRLALLLFSHHCPACGSEPALHDLPSCSVWSVDMGLCSIGSCRYLGLFPVVAPPIHSL